MDEVVAQDLVRAILAGAVQQRAVVVTASSPYMHILEHQLMVLLHHLSGQSPFVYAGPPPVTPTMDATPGVTIYRRLDRWKWSGQVQLASQLRNAPPSVGQIVVATRLHHEPLEPRLCQALLLDQFVDLDNPDLIQVRLSRHQPAKALEPLQLRQLQTQAKKVMMMPEILRYMEDVVLFVRTHRFVRTGITPHAVRDLGNLVRLLAVFQNVDYATPHTVKTAARMLLPLKVQMCAPEDEPSMEYGGDFEVARRWRKNFDAIILVESILEKVPVPY